MKDNIEIKKDAVISEDKKYRYLLERIWDPALPVLGVIMLNPSTADDKVDDPTIKNCISIAKKWNFGAIKVANMFALRSTDPKNLKTADDPVGPQNDSYLRKLASECSIILCGWGNKIQCLERQKNIKDILDKTKTVCLKINNDGTPRHPLYVTPPDTPLNYDL